MDAPQPRSVSQRKRSYSTTAYSSQEEEPLSNNYNNASSSSISQVQPSSLLATAVGSQVLTYEFINNGTILPASSSKSQQPPIAVPGQYEGIQMSNERTPVGVSSLKWSPDNTMLAVEAQDGRIFLHDNRGRFQESLVNEPIMEVSRSGSNRCVMSWAPKPQRLYFAMGNKVMTWDSTFKRTAETFEMTSRISALGVNAEDVLLAVGQNTGSVDVVNRSTGVSARLETPASLIMAKLEYSVFNRSILGGVGNDGVLRLWDAGSNGSTGIYHSFATTHEVPISGMAFSPFNRYLICTAGLDKRYALYDVEKKNIVKNTLTEYALTSVSFKNDGISMAFGTDQGKVLLYDLRSTSRPISIVDTRVNAPVTAVHFQGKQSSSMKRHQTINGHVLKRQNSAGSQMSVFSMKDSTVLAATTTTTTAASTDPIANSDKTTVPARQAPVKMATFSHPTLNQLASNGATQPTKEARSSSVIDFFSSRRGSDLASSTLMSSSVTTGPTTAARQDSKVSGKPRRPTAPTLITTTGGLTGVTSSNSPAPGTSKSAIPSAGNSMPTTPSREHPYASSGSNINNGNGSSSYPNSRTVSPFAFQTMQSRSPSGESSTSSSSVNTPPGSPGGHVESGPSNSNQNHRKHHHYQYHSSDSLSKSPSRSSRAKRRKSFGSLMASGGASSMPGTPDMFSDEKMEILRGQIVDRVRDVLLDHPSEPTTIRSNYNNASAKSKSGEKLATGASIGSTPVATQRPGPKARAPVKDLWLQVGLEGGNSNQQTSKTQSTLLGRSALPASASLPAIATGAIPSSSPSSSAMAIDSLQGSSAALSSNAFSSKILENVIEGCLMDFRTGIRNDIQNMHLELLRQFQIQKIEIEGLLKQYSDTKELREENERLAEENRRLRMNF
ncbi:Protein nedd1 [Mortierella sp. AD094]|nr:Protein nedd1 [Mortierella sp. AD094]